MLLAPNHSAPTRSSPVRVRGMVGVSQSVSTYGVAACPDSRWRVYPAGAGRAADGASRAVGPLGATWQGFLRIAGGQVVLAGLLGDAWNHVHRLSAWRDGVVLPLISTAVGAGMLLRA